MQEIKTLTGKETDPECFGSCCNPMNTRPAVNGDVFTAEPGLYDEKILRAGMRIENDYVVTETGVENLSPFAMEL